jgi:3-methyladenine DNA glycosylase Mpg
LNRWIDKPINIYEFRAKYEIITTSNKNLKGINFYYFILYTRKNSWKMEYKRFFGRKAEEVAKDLLGRLIVRNTARGTTAGKIVETGAYEGGKEVPSRLGMKYAPGKVFLMPFRGHYFFNIATDREGFSSCVEIRAVDFHDRAVKGSSAVANYLNLGKSLDGVLFGEELEISGKSVEESRIKIIKAGSDNCIGYFYIK